MTELNTLTEISSQGVATVTLNRPQVHNAFDEQLTAALTNEFQQLEDNVDVRCIILAAQGKSFSAGSDLSWMRRIADYDENQNIADAEALTELLRVLYECGKPTIARVQGSVFGAGVGLVACCDIAVASEHASFALTEVKLGLIPGVISPYVIKAIGARQTRRYMLSAERFDAREALRIGLVHKVVGDETLDEWITRLTRHITANGPYALAASKELIRAVTAQPLSAELRADCARRVAEIRVSDEGQEGLDAFLSKRKPDWVNE